MKFFFHRIDRINGMLNLAIRAMTKKTFPKKVSNSVHTCNTSIKTPWRGIMKTMAPVDAAVKKDLGWRERQERCTMGRMTIKSASTGSFAPPFAHSLVLLTPHCSLRSRALLRTAALIRSLARSLSHSRTHRKESLVHKMNALILNSFSLLCADGDCRER